MIRNTVAMSGGVSDCRSNQTRKSYTTIKTNFDKKMQARKELSDKLKVNLKTLEKPKYLDY